MWCNAACRATHQAHPPRMRPGVSGPDFRAGSIAGPCCGVSRRASAPKGHLYGTRTVPGPLTELILTRTLKSAGAVRLLKGNEGWHATRRACSQAVEPAEGRGQSAAPRREG